MKRTITGIGAVLLGLLGFATAQADTVISSTQYSYNYNNQVVCTAVRMNMAITQPADPCTPATTVGTSGPDRITENVYDAAGQLLAVYKASGTSNIIQYAYYNYTNNGLKAFEIDANHNKTTFTYDGFDRLSTIRYPNTTAGNEISSTTDYEQFAYDANNNKTWWKRRSGVYIYYNYDNLNREVLSYPGDSSIPNLYTGYDGLGHILWKRSGNNTPSTPGVTYAYDGLGRVVSVNDFNNRTINYQYNTASARTKLIFPEGNYVQYTLDNLNRVSATGLNGTTNVLFGQVFDSMGRRTSLTRGISSVGGATTYGYDNLSRLTSLANNLNGTVYDITWTFPTYNAANQIVTWGATSTVYDYVETATTTTAKTYDGLNRDATITAITGGYDTNGNLAKDGTRTMGYDVYNRLLTATGTGTYVGLNLKLVYDTEGRLAKYSTDGGTTYTTFLYDGTNLIAEYNNAGTLTERYIHGTGTDEPVVWYHGSAVTATEQKFLYQNYQGSVIAYADSAGIMGDYYKYGAYGEPKKAGNTDSWPSAFAGSGPRFRYTGQLALPEVGLYYYKARVYDPGFGRFLQTDPIGSKDDLDLYAYVGGDPINATDPTGNESLSHDIKKLGELINNSSDWIDKTSNKFADSVVGYANSLTDSSTNIITGKGTEADLLNIGSYYANVAAIAETAGLSELGTAAATVEVRASTTEAAAANTGSKIDRAAFAVERKGYWKAEAQSNSGAYSADNVSRMQSGKAPIGSDGHPMELHHVDGTPNGGVSPMTRTEHRLGENYQKNHPWLNQ